MFFQTEVGHQKKDFNSLGLKFGVSMLYVVTLYRAGCFV